jgi:hypothetical protein
MIRIVALALATLDGLVLPLDRREIHYWQWLK